MSLSTGRPSKNLKKVILSDVTDAEKKTVRVNFNLDEDKYIALKKYALDSRKTVTQLLTEMIDEKVIER
uniref:plasmid partition protein ParG n=1 Tax=Psychrobacter sp. TaxID=56811 RepID=UPI001598B40B|nr:plasmid partition protein ParG [Psychrobacter sp.]QJS05556.1 ParB protein [Psychrobacter sp.]